MTELIVQIIVIGSLLALGLAAGGITERRHLARLDARERDMADMLVTQLRSYPQWQPGASPPMFVVAEAVVATDYFKSFAAGLKNLFGGEVRSYQSLLIRARREAVVRLLEQARAAGYNAICNVRLDSADIGGNTLERKVAMAAILASATAYHAGEAGDLRLEAGGK